MRFCRIVTAMAAGVVIGFLWARTATCDGGQPRERQDQDLGSGPTGPGESVVTGKVLEREDGDALDPAGRVGAGDGEEEKKREHRLKAYATGRLTGHAAPAPSIP